MTKEQYLAAVRAVDGVREEERKLQELENMARIKDWDSLKITQTGTDRNDNYYANGVDISNSDLQALIDIHKHLKEQYEKDFIAI